MQPEHFLLFFTKRLIPAFEQVPQLDLVHAVQIVAEPAGKIPARFEHLLHRLFPPLRKRAHQQEFDRHHRKHNQRQLPADDKKADQSADDAEHIAHAHDRVTVSDRGNLRDVHLQEAQDLRIILILEIAFFQVQELLKRLLEKRVKRSVVHVGKNARLQHFAGLIQEDQRGQRQNGAHEYRHFFLQHAVVRDGLNDERLQKADHGRARKQKTGEQKRLFKRL